MADKLPDFDAHEVAFNVEAVRGYLFSAAEHVLESMTEQQVAHAAPAVMTAGLEFAAQLWMQVALQTGVPRAKARQTAEKQFRTFLTKHGRPKEQQEAKES